MDQSNKAKTRYSEMVKEASPNSHLLADCVKAFVSGGIICVIGQVINNTFASMGLPKDEQGTYTSIALIFLGVALTALGVYDKLGKFCGAGTVVPITGFANSVAAPAIEFKKEGLVLGVGAKMFLVAGPVIVYGLVTSILVGLGYYFFK